MKARKRKSKGDPTRRRGAGSVHDRYQRQDEEGGVSLRFVGWVALVFCAAVMTALAAAPQWWSRPNVLAPEQVQDNHAVVTVGQIKNLAVQAKAEMDVKLALDGGAGPEIDALVAGWYGPSGVPNVEYNAYAAATVGQLKAVAKPFYDRLKELDLWQSIEYPWSYGQPEDDSALVNAGQVKHVFSFEIPQAELGPLVMTARYYQQKMDAGQAAPFDLGVRVTRKGRPMGDIQVTMELVNGGGGLYSVSNPTELMVTRTVTTDGMSGEAVCGFKAPTEAGFCWIKATADESNTQWFLMIVGGGGGLEFPANPPGSSDVNYSEDSDEDGDTDAEEAVANTNPADPSSHLPDSDFVIVQTSWQTQWDRWSAHPPAPGGSSWTIETSTRIEGNLIEPPPEVVPDKPPALPFESLHPFQVPSPDAGGWVGPFAGAVTSPTTYSWSLESSAGHHDGVSPGENIPKTHWQAQAVKLQIYSTRKRPRPQSYTLLIFKTLVAPDLPTEVIGKAVLTLPATVDDLEPSAPVVLSFLPEIGKVHWYHVALVDVSWEAKPGYRNVDGHRDPWTKEVVGKRIFPDATQGDPQGPMSRTLEVHVKVPGVNQVFLKVFDVDDTSKVSDPNHILDPTEGSGDDNLVAEGSSENYGFFIPQNQSQISMELVEGEGKAAFKVNPQPGNNYRVALAINSESLNFLQVFSDAQPGYVPASDEQVPGFIGVVSEMLTVWRRLHVEMDSMQAVVNPKPSPDCVPATGSYYLGWTGHREAILQLVTPLPRANDFYKGGKIVAGSNEFYITGNDYNTISVQGLDFFPDFPPELLGNFTVFDDDDRGLGSAPLPKNLISKHLKGLYSEAFIDVVERTQNPNRSVPFKLYASPMLFDSSFTSAIDTNGDDWGGFWNCYLLAAYQPEEGSSFDGNGTSARKGVSRQSGLGSRYSAVFVEVCRDVTGGNLNIAAATERYLAEVAAHELGHGPNDPGLPWPFEGHPETGLMSEGAPAGTRFAAESLLRFRKAYRWYQ